MIRKPKCFKWAEMDYNAIQLERKISEYFTRDEKLSNSETSCFSERLNRSGIHSVIAVDNDTTDFVTVYLYDYSKRKFITKGKTVFTNGNLIDNIWSEIENLEKSINEDSLTENIKNNRRRVNEAISFKFKKVVIKKKGKEIPLSTNEIADIIEDIDVQYLSLITINNALRRNTFSIFKYGERPTDMTIYPDGMVELRYDDAKCYVYLIP